MKAKNILMKTQRTDQLNSFSNFQINSFPNWFIFKLTLIIVASSFSMGSCKSGGNEAQKPQAKKAPLVKVQPAITQKMVSFIEITGNVQANINTDVKSPIGGIVESLKARENQRVEKGRVIAVINPTERVSLISKNQQQIEAIEKKIASSSSGSDEYNQLIDELKKAKESFEYASSMYQTVPVICPMNGLVTQRWVDLGGQVTANEKMLTITDMSSLVVKAEVNEKYFEAIKQGKKLPLFLNAYPNDSLTGTISLVYPQIDPVTRSVKFDIRINNFSKNLLPGMMATIRIPVAEVDNAIAVPEHAVLTTPDNKNFLFTVDNDSIAHRRVVEIGIGSGSKIQIVKGIKPNEKVVVAGQEMLKDSIKVLIMKSNLKMK